MVSEAAGVKKPDPEIFRRALRQLNVTALETVFVGDNPNADIDAAKALGMKGVWIRNACWPPPARLDAAISQICELPRMIDTMSDLET